MYELILNITFTNIHNHTFFTSVKLCYTIHHCTQIYTNSYNDIFMR